MYLQQLYLPYNGHRSRNANIPSSQKVYALLNRRVGKGTGGAVEPRQSLLNPLHRSHHRLTRHDQSLTRAKPMQNLYEAALAGGGS